MMKTRILISAALIFVLQAVMIVAAEIPPTTIRWPIGAEELIDKAIGIKVKAQKQDREMFSEGGEHGHAFVKCLDELARILSENSFDLDRLKEKEGSDLKAKIALWSMDCKARPEEYARLEHLHVSDNPIGKAAAERKDIERWRARGEEGNRTPISPDGQPLRRPCPKVRGAPKVANDDVVEGNRWILEYLYFAPPINKRYWSSSMPNRWPLVLALTEIRNEKTLVMLKFDIEIQVETKSESDRGAVGAVAKSILDFRSPSAFRIVASVLHHDEVRRCVGERISFLSELYPDSEVSNPWFPKVQDYRSFANMEWQTDAEKELASWMKKIPDYDLPSNR